MKIGIISDIHEDVGSLKETLILLEKNKCDMIACLGDILGFDDYHYYFHEAPDGEECIRLVRENCSLVLAGNHDLFAVRRIPAFHAGIRYGTEWYEYNREDRLRNGKGKVWRYGELEEKRLLSTNSREFLLQVPEFATYTNNGMTIHFSHSLYPDLSGSTTKFPQWVPDLWPHLSWLKKNNCQIGFSGHLHAGKILMGNWFSLHVARRPIHRLKHSRSWFNCPPVVAGKVHRGFLTITTDTREIRSHIIG